MVAEKERCGSLLGSIDLTILDSDCNTYKSSCSEASHSSELFYPAAMLFIQLEVRRSPERIPAAERRSDLHLYDHGKYKQHRCNKNF